jgi:hypothetical protein
MDIGLEALQRRFKFGFDIAPDGQRRVRASS